MEAFALERHRNKQFKYDLDQADAKQASSHLEALTAVAEKQERTREDAKQAVEKLLLQERMKQQIAAQAEATQDQITQQQAIAQQQAELLERQRQVELLREEAQRLERQRLAEEHERQIIAHREVVQKAEREAAEARAKAPSPPPSAPPVRIAQPESARTTEPVSSTATTGADEHQQYLDLHSRLKQLRKDLMSKAKLDKSLKSTLGDNRREITKIVGQMTSGPSAKQANNGRVAAIVRILQQSKGYSNPSVDVRKYLIASRNLGSMNPADCQISAIYIYLLNIFVKSVVKQFVGEAGISPEKADPVGLLVAKIFSHPEFQWPGTDGKQYLTDILLAKFHKSCPLLFGIYGSIKTAAGRQRSGWRDDDDVQRYSERMTGLGAGFASITTRDFRRAKVSNPMPVALFWRSLALTVNTPPAQAIDAHFLVLKAMLDPTYVEKLVQFYGRQGIALVRKGAIDFPSQSNTSAANALKVLPDIYAKTAGLGAVVAALTRA